MINLKREQEVKLQDAINLSQLFSLEIGIKGSAVYDFSCFGLDSNERSRDEYFIYFNNLNCPDNAVILKGATNPAVFDLNLSNLSPDIIGLDFTATIDGDSTMGQISQCTIAIKQNNVVCFQMQMSGSDFINKKAIIAIKIYKCKDVWCLLAVGDGFDGDLSDLLKLYGLEEDSGLPPDPPRQSETQPNPQPQTQSRPQPAPNQHAMQETYPLGDGKIAYKYDSEEFIKWPNDWV
jgi:stress response protein SCP2